MHDQKDGEWKKKKKLIKYSLLGMQKQKKVEKKTNENENSGNVFSALKKKK